MFKRKLTSLLLNLSLISNIFTINCFATGINDIDSKIVSDKIIEEKEKWIKNFGGSEDDEFKYVAPTSDDGFIAVGYSKSTDIDGFSNNGGQDAIIVKYDKDGEELWRKNWGGKNSERFDFITETSDGRFVAVGYTYSKNIDGMTLVGERDAIIVKFDSSGNQLWINSIGGSYDDWFNSVIETSDGGYLAVGNLESTDVEGVTSLGDNDCIIAKYDSNGTKVWAKSWGGNKEDFLHTSLETSDGGYVIVGYSVSTDIEGITNKGGYDAIIVKFDSSGNQQWVNSIGGSLKDYFNSITETSDGSYVAVGNTYSKNISGITNQGEQDAIIVKFDSSGNQQWVNSIGGSNQDYFNSIIETSDGNCVAVGNTYSTDISGINLNGVSDALIVKYNPSGTQQWSKSFGGSGDDNFISIIQTFDENYLIGGYTQSIDIEGITSLGKKDAIIVKFLSPEKDPPELKHTLSPSTWTNGNVSIDITAIDATGIKEIILPNGNIIKSDTVSYTVSNNGTYYFNAIDNYDNIGNLGVKVTNIDKKKPIFNIEHNKDWTNENVKVNINGQD